MKAGAVVLLGLVLAFGDGASAGEPVPALIAFGGETGAGERALNVRGHALLDAVLPIRWRRVYMWG